MLLSEMNVVASLEAYPVTVGSDSSFEPFLFSPSKQREERVGPVGRKKMRLGPIPMGGKGRQKEGKREECIKK